MDTPGNQTILFLRQIQKQCQELTEFKICGNLSSKHNIDAVLQLVDSKKLSSCSFVQKNLGSSNIYPFHTDILLHLSSYTSLTRLEIGLHETATQILSTAAHGQFLHSLKHLHVITWHPKIVKAFIRALAEPTLVTLEVQIFIRSNHEAWMHLFHDVADSLDLSELIVLRVGLSKASSPAEIDPTWEQLGLTHIGPLFQAKKMQSLIIWANYGATGVSDTALLEIAAAWPALEHFHLINMRQTSVTASGFAEFARHSKSLRTITLDFDATVSPDMPFDDEENKNHVTEITIERLQELPDCMLVTKYFQKNFPRLEKLQVRDLNDSGKKARDWFDVQTSILTDWEDVDGESFYDSLYDITLNRVWRRRELKLWDA
jgi:hypothetical protein